MRHENFARTGPPPRCSMYTPIHQEPTHHLLDHRRDCLLVAPRAPPPAHPRHRVADAHAVLCAQPARAGNIDLRCAVSDLCVCVAASYHIVPHVVVVYVCRGGDMAVALSHHLLPTRTYCASTAHDSPCHLSPCSRGKTARANGRQDMSPARVYDVCKLPHVMLHCRMLGFLTS